MIFSPPLCSSLIFSDNKKVTAPSFGHVPMQSKRYALLISSLFAGCPLTSNFQLFKRPFPKSRYLETHKASPELVHLRSPLPTKKYCGANLVCMPHKSSKHERSMTSLWPFNIQPINFSKMKNQVAKGSPRLTRL